MTGAPGPPPSARPPGASRYGWFVGVVAILALAYIGLNTLRHGQGVGVRPGQRLPAFAVPLLFADVPKQHQDANVSRRACRVRDPRALNLCAYAAGHPLVLSLGSVKDDDSIAQLDAMQKAAPQLPGVRFAGVFLRGDRDAARRDARSHGWRFALGWDHFGDVAAVYGVRALPVLYIANARRRARAVEYRVVRAAELVRRLRRVR